jgi:hypothetical protein
MHAHCEHIVLLFSSLVGVIICSWNICLSIAPSMLFWTKKALFKKQKLAGLSNKVHATIITS